VWHCDSWHTPTVTVPCWLPGVRPSTAWRRQTSEHAADNFRVRAQLTTSCTNHGMQVPQLLILKLANAIQIETDLTLARQ
jgi:hypothetical protein